MGVFIIKLENGGIISIKAATGNEAMNKVIKGTNRLYEDIKKVTELKPEGVKK